MQKIVAKKMALGGGRMHSCFLLANTFLVVGRFYQTPPLPQTFRDSPGYFMSFPYQGMCLLATLPCFKLQAKNCEQTVFPFIWML